MHFEVIDLEHSNRWEVIIDGFPKNRKEIYYLPNYYRTWIEHQNAQPYSLYAKEDDIEFLYPFFKKEITGYDLNNLYYDIENAYGCGGVLTNIDIKKIPKPVLSKFNQKVDQWCKENNIIAEFICENPYIYKDGVYPRSAKYFEVRKNVYAKIDNNFVIRSKSARYSIARAAKLGLVAEIDDNLSTIEKFIYLYRQTAERIGMDSYYFFGEKYFRNLAKYLSNHTKIINIKHKNEIIAAAIIFFYMDNITYHLSCSDAGSLKFCPNDLLIQSIIDEGKKLGIKNLSLGGGKTADTADSLFVFKNKFGNIIKTVHAGKKIHNKSIYTELCEQWGQNFPMSKEKYANYVLKYRKVK